MDERRSLMATKTEVPTVADRLLDFYRRPAPMTSLGRSAPCSTSYRAPSSPSPGSCRGWRSTSMPPTGTASAFRTSAGASLIFVPQGGCWGAMPHPGERLVDDQLAFFNQIASLTQAPDESFEELRALYQGDERLRVPATVFNSLLNRPEPV